MKRKSNWTCNDCGTVNDDQFEICYKCGAIRSRRKRFSHRRNGKNIKFITIICCITALAILAIAGIAIFANGRENKTPESSDSVSVQLDSGGEYVMNAESSSEETSEKWYDIAQVYAGTGFSLGIKKDGSLTVKGHIQNYGEVETDLASEIESWEKIEKIVFGMGSVLGLREDGTVLSAGSNPEIADEVSQWRNVIDISAGAQHAYGVTGDGKVFAVGKNDFGEEIEVNDKSDIVKAIAVTCGSGNYSVFLDKYGVASDDLGWKESGIRGISSSGWLTLGIREDGTVSGSGEDYCRLKDYLDTWADIVQALPGDTCAVGLRADGTVATAGGFETDGETIYAFREAQEWANIKLLAFDGEDVLIGVKDDGTVVTDKRFDDSGEFSYYDLDDCLKKVETWTDIVDVVISGDHIIGLRSDGTALAVGNNDYGQCNL